MLRGVWKASPTGKSLGEPASTPPGMTWRYQLPFIFQVGPRTGALSLNIKPYPGPGQDFPCGVDLLTFDDIHALQPERALPLARNHDEPNPNADGKMAHMAKFPAQIGFVPLGARRPDGTPHPHAGTGFAVVTAGARPVDDSEGRVDFPDRVGISAFKGRRAYNYIERFQLSYDGRALKSHNMERLKTNEVVSGYELVDRGLSSAIPDGDDLLLPMKARRPDAAMHVSGIVRWRRSGGNWRPVDFAAITPEDNSWEPSAVRDVDGSVLFHGRGKREAGVPVRIWRQAPGSEEWELKLTRTGIASSAPVILSSAADGTPFVMLNLYQPQFAVPPAIVSDGGVSRLDPKGRRGERSTICLWALNAERDGFETPLIVKDPLVDYGVPPRGTIWAVDHPNATVLRLADGEWHSVFGYRMLEWIENTHMAPPSPQTGACIGEIISLGPPAPLWRFDA